MEILSILFFCVLAGAYIIVMINKPEIDKMIEDYNNKANRYKISED